MPRRQNGITPEFFPLTKKEEDRATSIFLAVFLNVYEFRKALMTTLNRSANKSGRDVEAYLHPSFGGKYSEKDIPDGLIIHSKRDKEWEASIEVKIKSSELGLPQIEKYLKRCVEFGSDALITISNEMCVSPSRPPLRLKTSDKKLQRIAHYHWSWTFIHFQAEQLLLDDAIEDEAQCAILEQFKNFLANPLSGAKGFKSMGPNYTRLVEDLRAKVSPMQEHLEEAVADWHQECAEVSLLLSRCMNIRANQIIAKDRSTSPEARLEKDVHDLLKTGDLKASYDVQDRGKPLTVTLDVDQRVLRIEKEFDLTDRVKTPYKKIEYFLRRFHDPEAGENSGQHEGVYIHASWPYLKGWTSTTLFDAIQDIVNEDLIENKLINSDKDSIQSIKLSYIPPKVGSKISSRKKVIELIEASVDHFCKRYVQQ